MALVQVTWLQLDCPHNGSAKQLCISFFREMDRLLGSRFQARHRAGRVALDEMVVHMARIADLHALGLLVIDEIQHRMQTPGASREDLLNVLVTLINKIGLPVMIVGTPTALPLLQGAFRQALRASGIGSAVWEPEPESGDWDGFVRRMWACQWTRVETPRTDEIVAVLRDESQGITNVVIKLYNRHNAMTAENRASATILAPAPLRAARRRGRKGRVKPRQGACPVSAPLSFPHERLISLDLARSLALLAMAMFHFTYDLDMLGWITRGTATSGFFWYFARIIAGSFIFLAGMGLWLAHGRGIRWKAFWRRETKIIAAALVVSIVTISADLYLGLYGLRIFYGILHSIAVSSLVGLAFLRWRAVPLLVLAAAVFVLPWVWSTPALDGPLVWLGLSGRVPVTADYQPFFPWFAPFLAGMATGRIFSWLKLWPRLNLPQTPLLRALAWPGRHSLAVYLIHQPILFGGLLGLTWLFRG